MPVLLFGVGAFAVVAGLVMIGFGIPINEFSFGNTLISAGTTAAVGGLIIIGLGVAVGQLRRIAEALGDQASARLSHPVEDIEASAAPRAVPAQGRIPYPQRAKAEPFSVESGASPLASSLAEDRAESFAPTLPNPDEESVRVEDDISLSPQQPQASTAPLPGMFEKRSEPLPDWRASPPPPPAPPRPQSANFDAMWPAEARPAKGSAAGEPKLESRLEPKSDMQPRDISAAKGAEPDVQKPRTVAILKSGVVDGMGYTLYVDGSIEAELPQGTLRFASINELRSHLEKNS
ncbi:MAG TPA: hypothetical protein VIV34_00520 [Pseudolabrys sp.]